MKRTLRILSLVAAAGGLAAGARADVAVFSENFNLQPAGAWPYVYNYDGGGNPNAAVLAGVGVGGSQALNINRNALGSGTPNFGVGSGSYSVSGNTSASLSDYTLSFDLALGSGSVSDFIADFLVYSDGSHGTDVGISGGNLPVPGAGFQHYSFNMGTLGTMWTGNALVPTASSWTFSLGKYGGSTAGIADIYIDNIQVSIVPEPSTVALAGLGFVAVAGRIRRRA